MYGMYVILIFDDVNYLSNGGLAFTQLVHFSKLAAGIKNFKIVLSASEGWVSTAISNLTDKNREYNFF